jgi:hypothetical protein
MTMNKTVYLTILCVAITLKIQLITNETVLEIPKSDIIHTASGLILHYTSEYRPSNKIVTFTVTFPMVKDMCYLIPLSAVKKIPACKRHLANSTNVQPIERSPIGKDTLNYIAKKPRQKRFIPQLISLAVGFASLIFGTANTIMSINLKSEQKNLAQAVQINKKIMNNNRAQILHLSEGELRLAHELNYTEFALNQTIRLVNEQSEVLLVTEDKLRTITSMTLYLNEKLNALTHAMETHFIHTSIVNIMKHNLNLDFIHHQDLPKVVDLILGATNITFDETNSAVPIIVLITKLLVQQRIDFLPAESKQKNENGEIIGKLVFTSFFAASDQ